MRVTRFPSAILILTLSLAAVLSGCSADDAPPALGEGPTAPVVTREPAPVPPATPAVPATVVAAVTPAPPVIIEPDLPPPATAEPDEGDDGPEPAPAPEEIEARLQKQLDVIFGREGIQSPVGVTKFNRSWDESLAPLLGERFEAYREQFPGTAAETEPQETTGGKKKRRRRRNLSREAKQAVTERIRAAYDPAWGVAESDLPRLASAFAAAFEAAKGYPPPLADEPRAVPGGPWPGKGVQRGAPDGFAQKATGGGGGPVRNVPAEAEAVRLALETGGNIQVAGGDVDADFNRYRVRSHTTFDGGGLTLWFPGTDHNGKGLAVFGQNIIIRNLRIRNSGDGVFFGDAAHQDTATVLAENVSVTGCGDDGFSVAYGCSDITIRWCLMAGNLRCLFHKYGGANLTMHHNILSHYWIRGPLCNGAARIDFRNNLVQNWSMWGSRIEDGARGDFINNTWRFDRSFGGKADTALYTSGGGRYHSAGNQFEGCSSREEGSSGERLVNGPDFPTDDAATALQRVLSDTEGAGCMPRNQLDRNYLASERRCPGGDAAHGLQVEGSRLGD